MRDAKVRFGVSENFAEGELSLIKQNVKDVSERILHSKQYLLITNLDNNTERFKILRKSKKPIKSNSWLNRLKKQFSTNTQIAPDTMQQLSGGGAFQSK